MTGDKAVTEVTTQELRDLILSQFSELDRRIELGLSALEKKIDLTTTELNSKIDLRVSELDSKIDLRASELDSKVDLGLAHVATEVARLEGKIGALDTKVDSIDRRISNEEIVSRSLFIAVIGGLVAGLVKFLFFPSSLT
jgi:hypothetical protein